METSDVVRQLDRRQEVPKFRERRPRWRGLRIDSLVRLMLGGPPRIPSENGTLETMRCKYRNLGVPVPKHKVHVLRHAYLLTRLSGFKNPYIDHLVYRPSRGCSAVNKRRLSSSFWPSFSQKLSRRLAISPRRWALPRTRQDGVKH